MSRAYAEYVIGPAHKFYKLPANVGFEEAALVDTFSVCLHAHHLSGLGINGNDQKLTTYEVLIGQAELQQAIIPTALASLDLLPTGYGIVLDIEGEHRIVFDAKAIEQMTAYAMQRLYGG